jgi:hypothetical protein
MADVIIEHMHKDLESLKREVSLIRHILSEEGDLSPEAKKRLENARQTPKSEYLEI